MKKITKIVALVLAGFFVLSAVFAGLVMFAVFSIFDSEPEEGSFTHEVEYSMEFRPNGTLNDTVLLLPYPEDERFQDAINGNISNVSVHNELNTSLSITNTSRGEMLRLDVGDFTPETRDDRFDPDTDFNRSGNEQVHEANVSGLNEYTSYDLVIRVDYNRTLDTRNGLTAEPHLKSEDAECQSPHAGDCATTEAFVSYDTSNDTHAELNVDIEGRNSWWNWGWSGNHYSQRFYNSFYDDDNLVGSQDDWVTLRGREEQGEGSYRH